MVIPIPPWAYAAAAGIAVAGGFAAGWKVRSWRCDAALSEALQKAAKERAILQAQVETQATDYEGERADATVDHTTRETTIRTIYRDIAVPADCTVPDSARGVLQGAIDRANARSAGEPVAALPAPAEPSVTPH